MSKRIKTILQYLFFLGLGVFLVWLSVKDIDAKKWKEIKDSLDNARFYLVIPVFAILFLSHYVRGLRWRLLMEPLGYRPSRLNVFFAVMIGYLANQAVPRLGEVLKCTVLARYEKLPADKLVGTIVLERLIDAISLLLIFALTLAVQPGLYNQLMSTVFVSSGTGEKTSSLPAYLIPLGIVVLVGVSVIGWMIIKKKTLKDLIAIFKTITARVWQGLTTIRHLKKRKQFVFLTILLWICYISGGYIGFFALQQTQHYGFKEALTVLSAGSVGMILTPGGIGAYAYLIENTMQLYGLNKIIALAFGWLLWLAQTAVVLIGGLFSLIALPIYNKKVSKVQEVPEV